MHARYFIRMPCYEYRAGKKQHQASSSSSNASAPTPAENIPHAAGKKSTTEPEFDPHEIFAFPKHPEFFEMLQSLELPSHFICISRYSSIHVFVSRVRRQRLGKPILPLETRTRFRTIPASCFRFFLSATAACACKWLEKCSLWRDASLMTVALLRLSIKFEVHATTVWSSSR